MATYRGGVPRYLQIARRLQERIDSGELPAGTRLPSELELCEEFGVNRLTLRQAMAELDRAASVEIRRGIGTFVRPPAVRLSIAVDPRTQQMDVGSVTTSGASGRDVGSELVVAVQSGDDSPIGAEVAAHLHRRPEELTRVDTVIQGAVAAESTPVHDRLDVAVSSYWIAADLLPAPTIAPGRQGNLILAVCGATGIELEYDWRAFSAVGADLADADLLGVAVGAPLLVREGVSCSPDGEPVLYVRRRMKGDAVRFVLQYRTGG
ncbi:GntR family transcriptional regulator [Kitasatospora sp. NPDC005856]|uniref:GntR family transcriptional regulator n=1 Tax=Kitasatospora sp. NPDC005856 TaxID=3154566 RepID=UPI0033C9BF17